MVWEQLRGSLQSSLQLRVEVLWVRDKVLHYPGARVALRTEAEHPRARGEDILGAHVGKEGYDVSASRDGSPSDPTAVPA